MTATNLALASIKSTGSSATRTLGDRFADVINAKDYGAKGDGIFLSATTSITSGANALTVAGASFASGDVGKMISVAGAGAAGATLITTISGFTDSTHVSLTANAGTTLSAVASTQVAYGTNDTTALAAAITAAIAAGVPLYIPTGLYENTGLTISGNLTIIGSYVAGNWAGTGQINLPGGSPPLAGAVLHMASNGSNAITISGTAVQVNIQNIGVLFQTLFSGTGDGINYLPASTNQGLSGSSFSNVMIYGHDGNHYAYNLRNPIYGTWLNVSSYGGGALKITTNAGNFGNMTFVQFEGQVVTGGTANGVDLSADASQHLNLLTFIRPQINVNNSGVSLGNLPTSAQSIWVEDQNVTGIRKIAADLETNVSSTVTLGKPTTGNDIDLAGLFSSAASIKSPAWTTNGFGNGQTTRTYTDTTSSGTVAAGGTFVFPGNTIAASSAVTFTEYGTLYLPAPVAGTNVTLTSPASLYAAGPIRSALSITGSGFFSAGPAAIYNATTPPAGGTANVGIRLSNVTNFGVFFGTGAPTLSAAKGSLYLRRDGSTTNDRMYVNTDGSTTWTAVTTAA